MPLIFTFRIKHLNEYSRRRPFADGQSCTQADASWAEGATVKHENQMGVSRSEYAYGVWSGEWT